MFASETDEGLAVAEGHGFAGGVGECGNAVDYVAVDF